MRKIIILNIVALFVASAAFAETSQDVKFDDGGKTLYGSLTTATKGDAGTMAIGKLSNKVGLAINCDKDGYALITQHSGGIKAYGTSHDSTSIFVKDVTKGEAEGAPSAADSTDFVTGTDWKSL
ncbi:MAG: hypothetical protein PHD01_08120 [Geobacteraceae bacterium]|nr:hypothetical protein [Geobacteraceae bacterium]